MGKGFRTDPYFPIAHSFPGGEAMNPRRRIRLGISACLLGEPVRYDATHRASRVLLESLPPEVEPVPICPEMLAGLGVPREPIQLAQDGKDLVLRGVESHRDVSAAMMAMVRDCRDLLMTLDGMILKSRSPSCGLADIPVFQAGEVVLSGSGYFVRQLLKLRPDLPVIEESALAHQNDLTAFLEKIPSR